MHLTRLTRQAKRLAGRLQMSSIAAVDGIKQPACRLLSPNETALTSTGPSSAGGSSLQQQTRSLFGSVRLQPDEMHSAVVDSTTGHGAAADAKLQSEAGIGDDDAMDDESSVCTTDGLSPHPHPDDRMHQPIDGSSSQTDTVTLPSVNARRRRWLPRRSHAAQHKHGKSTEKSPVRTETQQEQVQYYDEMLRPIMASESIHNVRDEVQSQDHNDFNADGRKSRRSRQRASVPIPPNPFRAKPGTADQNGDDTIMDDLAAIRSASQTLAGRNRSKSPLNASRQSPQPSPSSTAATAAASASAATTASPPPPLLPFSETDDNCTACLGKGKLLCCDTCPRVFHFSCVEEGFTETNVPEGVWQCKVCVAINPESSLRAAKTPAGNKGGHRKAASTSSTVSGLPSGSVLGPSARSSPHADARNGLMGPLISLLDTMQPRTYRLPHELRTMFDDILTHPGTGEFIDTRLVDVTPVVPRRLPRNAYCQPLPSVTWAARVSAALAARRRMLPAMPLLRRLGGRRLFRRSLCLRLCRHWRAKRTPALSVRCMPMVHASRMTWPPRQSPSNSSSSNSSSSTAAAATATAGADGTG
ncbi:hypothetical protein BC831DRAFT_181490 [Entophlyctis helioformis]|nr:hypothetical protein BC831DRAFT_181490 [Entophlyctis helioformis]